MQHGKLQARQCKVLATLGHMAHFVRYQAANGVKVGVIQADPKGFTNALNGGVATDAVASVGQTKNVAVVFCNVKFVFNLANDLLQHIFNRDQARHAAKLVNHNG